MATTITQAGGRWAWGQPMAEGPGTSPPSSGIGLGAAFPPDVGTVSGALAGRGPHPEAARIGRVLSLDLYGELAKLTHGLQITFQDCSGCR